MFFGLVLLILVIWILIKNILSPLEELNRFTEKISHLNFSPIEIKTGDEIEDLSSSINEMSDKDVEEFVRITGMFSESVIKIVAGRHYGAIVSATDLEEKAELFLSFGDLELSMNSF